MHNTHKHPEVPLLNQSSLQSLLLERFDDGFSKLSDIPNPALLKNAQKSVERIAQAIHQKQKITLVGDYDVDGVSSTSIMILFFREINYPLEAIIPNRFTDGYGVSPNVLRRVNADLVITVDNGIAALEAAQICKDRGIDLIITDHHTPSDTLPDAYAIVNPKLKDCPYPFKEICGAQVAWLLLALLKKEMALQVDMKQYFDILALAIIADVMPLIGINRAMVQAGLQLMAQKRRPSSSIICEFLNKKTISSEDIGFQIAPRVNSAGRLEDAILASEFLTAPDEHTAYSKFELLTQLNELRKATEAEVSEDARSKVNPSDKIIVVAGENYHEGVVGIVASRLVQEFGRPAIVLNIKDGVAKGSARSVGEINIYDLLRANDGFLTKFGGHKMAAGMSLREEDIEHFKDELNKDAEKFSDEDFLNKEELVGELEPSALDLSLLTILDQFEPYGEGNPRPRFFLNQAELVNIKFLGADKSHSKLNIRTHSHMSQTYDLIAFRQRLSMPKDRRISCSYTVNKNEWNGKVSLQFMLDRVY